MQHVFFNDIGDYMKYAFLRGLAGETGPFTADPWQLAVVWYLNVGHGTTQSHLSAPDKFRGLDSALCDGLIAVEDDIDRAHLARFEQAGLLPDDTIYVSTPMPSGKKRAAWFEDARAASRACPLVFLDPDNGVATATKVANGRGAGLKHTDPGEIIELLADGHLVVVFHERPHQPNYSSADLIGQITELAAATGTHLEGATAVISRVRRQRYFACFAATDTQLERASEVAQWFVAQAAATPGLSGKVAVDYPL
jgi:hypothetical protein